MTKEKTKLKPEDYKIVPEEEAFWEEVVKARAHELKVHKDNLKYTEFILEMSKQKLAEVKTKSK